MRNLSIIAHVDHGKTTLVDAMLRQAGLLAAADPDGDEALVMDSMDLERERGITIMAKHTAFSYRGVKLNLVDTPGHADFGGEVERSLAMVDGVLLLVDCSEGPLPQTRFVLEKALARRLPVIVVVNKIDRADARPQEVLDEVYDLFIDLDADEEQLDFPVVYAIGRDGVSAHSLDEEMESLAPLLDTILEKLPAPDVDPEGPGRFQAVMLDYDEYVGRLALGRIDRGSLRKGERYLQCAAEGAPKNVKLTQLFVWEGLTRKAVDEAGAGELVAIAGSDAIEIGDTLCAVEHGADPLPRITVEEPTVSIQMGINDGPFSGKSGNKLTSRQILSRLEKESLHNVSIRVEATGSADRFSVAGRGELQLGILVEQMRREGFEMVLSRPEVIEKEVDGKRLEPYERVTIDAPASAIGAVTELLSPRAGRMLEMDNRGGRVRMIFRIPARGLIGVRNQFLTRTRGEGLMFCLFDGYDTRAGTVARRSNGALVADRSGKVTGYAAESLQARGVLFVAPGDEVYEGMIVGEHSRTNDLNVNIVRPRKLTNMRAAAADELVVLDSAKTLTLEEAIDWIDDDELVEVTPDAVRLRKKILPANRRSIRRT